MTDRREMTWLSLTHDFSRELRSALSEYEGEAHALDEPSARRLAAVCRGYLGYLRELGESNPPVIDGLDADGLRADLRACLARLLPACAGPPRSCAEELRALIDGLPERVPLDSPYRFSGNWQFPHARAWMRELEPLAGRPHLSFLEVGSYEGRSACWLLENILTADSSRLLCADAFEPLGPGAEPYEALFDSNIAATGAAHKVSKLKGIAQETLRTLRADQFDFVYLDASSTASEQLEDAVLSWRLVRCGGLVVFDDCGGDKSYQPGVRRAVEMFLSAIEGQYVLLRDDFQISIRRTAPPGLLTDAGSR